MLPSHINETNCTQINWKDIHGEIVVTPENEDRFVIRTRKAAEALQRDARFEIFHQQMKLLLKVIVEWLSKNNGKVKGSHITLRDGRLAFVVVRQTCGYDEDFEDRLSDLDIKIANDPDLDLIELDTIGLPDISNNALYSFMHPDFQITLEHAKS